MRSLPILFLLVACTGAPAPQADATPDAPATPAATAPEKADKPMVAGVGQMAPDFELTDLDGKTHKLSDYKGKTVVLEWFNPGCPFVVAAHDEGPLKDMAKASMGKDVVWLAINSGAPGKQGHGVDVNKSAATEWGMENPILIDEDGKVGRMFAAKTTPQMVVIQPDGTIGYGGALDNAPRNEPPEAGYQAFTQNAVDAVLGGEKPSPAKTQPWGCSVKYSS